MAGRRDADRRRGRGRRRPHLRRRRRGGRDHAPQLPPDPGRPRLQDAAAPPSASGWPRSSGDGRSRSASGRRRWPTSTGSTSTTRPTSRCAARSPASATTTTCWSTATGSPTSSSRSGPYTAIVDGDARVYSIACASVVAKTVRDRMMAELHARYPEYGWDRNQGYATREHRAAIRAHGLTPHHRSGWQAIQVLIAGDQLGLFDDAGDGRRPPDDAIGRHGLDAAGLLADESSLLRAARRDRLAVHAPSDDGARRAAHTADPARPPGTPSDGGLPMGDEAHATGVPRASTDEMRRPDRARADQGGIADKAITVEDWAMVQQGARRQAHDHQRQGHGPGRGPRRPGRRRRGLRRSPPCRARSASARWRAARRSARSPRRSRTAASRTTTSTP